MKLSKAVEEWQEWLGETISPSLKVSYEKRLRAWKHGLKHNDLDKATDWRLINKFLREKGKHVRYTTIKQYIATFRSFFKFVNAEGYISKDPGKLIRIRPQLLSVDQLEDKERIPFTFAEYEKVLAFCVMQEKVAKQRKTREWARFWRVAVPLSYWTGIRLMDCASLEIGNFRKDGMVFWTKKRNKRVLLPYADPHIGHPHLIHVVDLVLHEYMTPDTDLVNKWIENSMSWNKMKVFEKQASLIQAEGRSQFSQRFARVLKTLRITGKSFHCLRHSFATRLEEAGVSYDDIAVYIGHSNTDVTQGYCHASVTDPLSEASDALNNISNYTGGFPTTTQKMKGQIQEQKWEFHRALNRAMPKRGNNFKYTSPGDLGV